MACQRIKIKHGVVVLCTLFTLFISTQLFGRFNEKVNPYKPILPPKPKQQTEQRQMVSVPLSGRVKENVQPNRQKLPYRPKLPAKPREPIPVPLSGRVKENVQPNRQQQPYRPKLLGKPREPIVIPENFTGNPCNYTLRLPEEERMKVVSSYKFPGVQDYIKDLFPKLESRRLPKEPMFVTGFSSNHYREALSLIDNFNNTININNNKLLLVYDIGLTNKQLELLKTDCIGVCKVRQFPFHAFPDHIGILKGYAWKPLIIQLVAKEHPFVVWMDASIRFRTSNIDPLIQNVTRLGVMAGRGGSFITAHSSREMFKFLNEPPCLFRRLRGGSGNFVWVYQTPFIREYFMKPWVSCALARGCMVPKHNVHQMLFCNNTARYFDCHRFDQSMEGLLFNRLFPGNVHEHFISVKLYSLCRGCIKRGSPLGLDR